MTNINNAYILKNIDQEELNKLNVEYVICVNASPYEFNKTKNKLWTLLH